LAQLAAPQKQIESIPGATHLFKETGALERVSDLALRWFKNYLPSAGSA
jgi:putative phosphoribosyl transferase